MKIFISVLFCVFFLTSNISVFAQKDQKEKNSILTSKFEFEIGTFFNVQEVKLSGNADLPDYGIEFNEAVDLNNYKSTFFFNIDWRFSRMWKLTAEYLSINNTNSLALNEDFPLRDYVFEKGSTVSSGSGMDLYRVFAGRIITKGLKHEFGAGLGVHVVNMSVSLEGAAKIDGEVFPSAKASSNTLLPLPNVAIWYVFAPTEKWSFEARTDWFGIKIDNISGLLWDIEPKVNFEITQNFGLGASYRFFKLSAVVNNSDWDGKFDMKYKGPTFSLHGRF